jgi:cell wall-associated NlpC family hydrolase
VLDFVTLCLQQVGDHYVWAATPAVNDPNPSAFDCSSLVQWAAGQVGVTLPRFSGDQWQASKKAGLAKSVADAKTIRGALLWKDNGNIEGGQHVAVSLGDGVHTVEARGAKYGVIQGGVADIRWDRAGLVPGMNYGVGDLPAFGALGGVA